jgi:hypothetical protein
VAQAGAQCRTSNSDPTQRNAPVQSRSPWHPQNLVLCCWTQRLPGILAAQAEAPLQVQIPRTVSHLSPNAAGFWEQCASLLHSTQYPLTAS